MFDTRGVLAVHGFPGLLGALACIIATSMANYGTYKSRYRIITFKILILIQILLFLFENDALY